METSFYNHGDQPQSIKIGNFSQNPRLERPSLLASLNTLVYSIIHTGFHIASKYVRQHACWRVCTCYDLLDPDLVLTSDNVLDSIMCLVDQYSTFDWAFKYLVISMLLSTAL